MSIDSDLLLDHIHSPYHQGPCPHPTTAATAINPLCGDEVQLQLRIAHDQIAEAWFEHHGCAISRAGASVLCEKLEGQSVADVAAIGNEESLMPADVQLSPIRRQCFLLAIQALRQILATFSAPS